MRRRWLLLVAALLTACPRETGAPSEERPRLTFVHQPLWGAPEPFEALLDGFRRAHPGVALRTQLLPNASDVAHQYLLTALEGGAEEPDVLVVDVVWVPEFAHAGWLVDLTPTFPPEALARDLLPGPARAVQVDGRTFAMPWYVDVGLLYYRADLVPRAPATYAEMVAFAQAAQARDASLAGSVWQGRQYEGLVCNVAEVVWGHGGQVMDPDGRPRLDTPAARAALGWLRGLITSGVSPPWVTSAAEEECRRPFQAGRAVFMRNWPYAWSELEGPDSPVRGKVGVAPLPTLSGEPGFGALGGWQLAVNAHSPPARREAALALVRHLTSEEAALTLALSYARLPARRATYQDERLRSGAPFLAGLEPMVARARPRPVTPYYNLLSDELQSELSAAVVGVRGPAEALGRAQVRVDHLLGATR